MKNIGCGTSLLVIIGAIILFSQLGKGPSVSSQPVSSTPAPAQTPEQIRRTEVEKCFSSWDGSHQELTRYIKARMKNPKSFEHVETRFKDNTTHLIVICKYRGTNGFGAVVTETVIAETLTDCQVKKILSQ